MVVGKEDLGLTLTLACSNSNSNSTNNHFTTSTPTLPSSTPTPTLPHNNNMGFLMMMNTNPNPNHNNNNNNNNNTISKTPLSLSSSSKNPLQLNLMMNPSINNSTPSPSFLQKLHPYRTTDSFPLSDKSTDSGKIFLKGIDVNRPAGGGGGDEEEVGVSSPNSTVSTLSGGKRSRDSGNGGGGDEMEVERAESRGGISDDGDDDGDGDGDNSRKKLRLTKDQSAILEETFKEHNTLNPKQKLALAKRLGLRPRQVEVWFQNRRARTKLKQTEVDCEFLKRCCEQLTEENRRLQKEVQELRTLKLSPQFYMQMTPPTTLTMCPSCERVAVPSSSSASHLKPVSVPDPRTNPRVNPWVASPLPIRSFDRLHPRS